MTGAPSEGDEAAGRKGGGGGSRPRDPPERREPFPPPPPPPPPAEAQAAHPRTYLVELILGRQAQLGVDGAFERLDNSVGIHDLSALQREGQRPPRTLAGPLLSPLGLHRSHSPVYDSRTVAKTKLCGFRAPTSPPPLRRYRGARMSAAMLLYGKKIGRRVLLAERGS